eukprot:1929070-Pyramimonas_sp.AAC.1
MMMMMMMLMMMMMMMTMMTMMLVKMMTTMMMASFIHTLIHPHCELHSMASTRSRQRDYLRNSGLWALTPLGH